MANEEKQENAQGKERSGQPPKAKSGTKKPKSRKRKKPPKKAERLRWTVRDSVFSCLFRQRKYLRELYLVLHPEDADVKTTDIRIITIENVLTNGEHNDLGFLVRNSLLVLVEAQTTFSVNLGLRLLLYVAETYRRLGDERGWDVYSSRALEVPRPELVVIYAGSATNVPDSLRVSVVYQQDKEGAAKPEKTEDVLDAGIKILRFRGTMDVIDQYIRFCEITAEKEKLFGRTQEAIDAIFRACREEGVLVAFLRSKEKEVRDIMTSLFDETRIRELHDNTIREEGRAEGREAGMMDIISKMLRRNEPISKIMEYTDATAEKIAEIARSIGVAPVT